MGTSQKMLVRWAQPADAHALAQLHTTSWRLTYRGQLTDAFLDGPVFEDRLTLWTGRLANPSLHQAIIWVATLADDVVGLACAFAHHDERWGTLLENLHVAPDHKRQGIGQLLFDAVRQWADQSTQSQWLHLWVLASNHPAQHFYQQLDAQHVESGTWHAPDGSCLPQYRYAWPLTTHQLDAHPHGSNQNLRTTRAPG
jgi:GNAT superfamily N-acetyltransferase